MQDSVGFTFANGLPMSELSDGAMVQGKVGDDDVILARSGEEFFAVGANCTHYGGPLAKGLISVGELRCPLHHACFSLRTGEAVRAPAFDPIPCWRVERVGDSIFMREKLPSPRTYTNITTTSEVLPTSVVIVGGGAAGLVAADTLRREGYEGPVTILSADDSAPYDRPNLSKEYLTGEAAEEWMPLRSPDYYTNSRIDLVLKA